MEIKKILSVVFSVLTFCEVMLCVLIETGVRLYFIRWTISLALLV
jgi:hypothetical protein